MNVQEVILAEKIDPFLTNANLTRQLIGAGVEASVLGHRVLTGGCWNRVISISLSDNRELVCKISPNQHDDKIGREFDVLSVFASRTTMPVPEPILLDSTGEIIPGTLLVMSMIGGVVMYSGFGLLDARSRRSVSKQIGRHVSDLHKIVVHGFGPIEYEESDRHERWSEFWLPRFDLVLDEIVAGTYIDTRMVEEIREVRPHFSNALDTVTVGTFTHYDIWSGNVMIDPERATVSGFIDIPGYYADYARELSFMMLFGIADGDFFEEYLTDHTLDDGFELRVNLYNLKMNLKHIAMYPSERHYRDGAAACSSAHPVQHDVTNSFKEKMSDHLKSLIGADPDGPVARQFSYSDREENISPYDLADPLGELVHSPESRLVRKYHNRALLLVTDTCAAHCRYCFRRNFTGGGQRAEQRGGEVGSEGSDEGAGEGIGQGSSYSAGHGIDEAAGEGTRKGMRGGVLSEDELLSAADYLIRHHEIDELLLSGGDPLTVPRLRLDRIVTTIKSARPDIILRLCTRLPITDPTSVDSNLIRTIVSWRPVWVVVQINHKSELSPESRRVIEGLVDSGLPVVSQTVLLAGVNDSDDVLADLFEELLRIRVQPYQLFQGDLVPGTAHFRVPLKSGVSIYQRLRARVSTLALPVYAVDAPGGGGKIALSEHSLDRLASGYFLLEGADGNSYRYPDEPDRSIDA